MDGCGAGLTEARVVPMNNVETVLLMSSPMRMHGHGKEQIKE